MAAWIPAREGRKIHAILGPGEGSEASQEAKGLFLLWAGSRYQLCVLYCSTVATPGLEVARAHGGKGGEKAALLASAVLTHVVHPQTSPGVGGCGAARLTRSILQFVFFLVQSCPGWLNLISAE